MSQISFKKANLTSIRLSEPPNQNDIADLIVKHAHFYDPHLLPEEALVQAMHGTHALIFIKIKKPLSKTKDRFAVIKKPLNLEPEEPHNYITALLTGEGMKAFLEDMQKLLSQDNRHALVNKDTGSIAADMCAGECYCQILYATNLLNTSDSVDSRSPIV